MAFHWSKDWINIFAWGNWESTEGKWAVYPTSLCKWRNRSVLSTMSTGSPSTRHSVFLLKETVQIGGTEVSSLADVIWKAVYLTSWAFFFFARGNCKSAKEKWSLSPTSTRSLFTRRQLEVRLPDVMAIFFIFARGICKSGKQKWSLSPTSTRSLSTWRQLEVRLPDVMAIFLFLLVESANRPNKSDLSHQHQLEVCLPDIIRKSVYPTLPWSQLEVRLPDIVYFCSRKLCKSAEQKWVLSQMSSGRPSTWPHEHFFFLLEETANQPKKSDLSRQHQLEVCLPDVNWKSFYPTSWPFFLFLLEESANRANKSDLSRQHQLEVCLPDVNWKSVYLTSWPFFYFCSWNLQIGQTKVISLTNIN